MTPDETIAQLRADLEQAHKTLSYFISGAPAEAKLIADLAREKERADKAEISTEAHRRVMEELKTVLAGKIIAGIDAQRLERALAAETRLAALQAHADGLAKAMDGALQVADRTTVEFYTARNALTAYRAFTAEGLLKNSM